MVEFQFQGKEHHIDGRLKKYCDKAIIPDIKKRDKDGVFLVDGRERGGKSVFAQGFIAYCASQLGTKVDMENICMTPLELRQKIQTAKKNECIVYDEAHRGMASSRALSEINNILKDLFMEMGQRNLLVIIVLPSFFLLDKYAALFRSRGLFHMYESKGRRGYWCFFNEKNKLMLYLKGKKEFNYHAAGRWPRSRGRFYNEYVVDEAEYRAKKAESFTDTVRVTKQENYIMQRNALAYLALNEMSLSVNKLTELSEKYGFVMTYDGMREVIDSARAEIGEIVAEKPEKLRVRVTKYDSINSKPKGSHMLIAKKEKLIKN